MTIFAIRNTPTHFQQLALQLPELFSHVPDSIDIDQVLAFSQLNASLAAWWPTPETHFIPVVDSANTDIPDISQWLYASLVLSPRAYAVLYEHLHTYGEFLPINVGEERFYIFNGLTFAEEDEAQCLSERQGDETLGLKKLVFKAQAEELLVFKSALENAATLYCNERFRQTVEEHQLTGVVFGSQLIEVFGH